MSAMSELSIQVTEMMTTARSLHTVADLLGARGAALDEILVFRNAADDIEQHAQNILDLLSPAAAGT